MTRIRLYPVYQALSLLRLGSRRLLCVALSRRMLPCPTALATRLVRNSYLDYCSTSDHRYLLSAIRLAERSRTQSRRLSVTKPVVSISLTGWSYDFERQRIGDSVSVSPPAETVQFRRRKRSDVVAALGMKTSDPVGWYNRLSYEFLPEGLAITTNFSGEVVELPMSTATSQYASRFLSVQNEKPEDHVRPQRGYVDGFTVSWKRKLVLPRFQPVTSTTCPYNLAVRALAGASGTISQEQLVGTLATLGDTFQSTRFGFELGADPSSRVLNEFDLTNWVEPTSREFAELPSNVLPVDVTTRRQPRKNPGLRRSSVFVESPLVSEITNATVSFRHVVRNSRGNFISDGPSGRPTLDFVSGQWDLVHGSQLRRNECLVRRAPVATRYLDDAFLMRCRVSSNYFHCLIEGLPRLLHLSSFEEECGTILIPDDIPMTLKPAVSMLTSGHRVVEIQREETIHVGRLTLPNAHTALFDSRIEPWAHGCKYYWPLIDEFVASMMGLREGSTPASRVFLIRNTETSSGRGLRNQDQLLQIAKEFGFVSIDPSRLSFGQQIALFSHAQVIVGAGGAAMANLIFAHAGLKVLALVSHELRDFVMFSTLADHAGAQYFTLTGPQDQVLGGTAFRRDLTHGDFWISPSRFKRALRHIC